MAWVERVKYLLVLNTLISSLRDRETNTITGLLSTVCKDTWVPTSPLSALGWALMSVSVSILESTD